MQHILKGFKGPPVQVMDVRYLSVELSVCVMEIQLSELWRLPRFKEETSHSMVKFPLEMVRIVPAVCNISINFCSNVKANALLYP